MPVRGRGPQAVVGRRIHNMPQPQAMPEPSMPRPPPAPLPRTSHTAARELGGCTPPASASMPARRARARSVASVRSSVWQHMAAATQDVERTVSAGIWAARRVHSRRDDLAAAQRLDAGARPALPSLRTPRRPHRWPCDKRVCGAPPCRASTASTPLRRALGARGRARTLRRTRG